MKKTLLIGALALVMPIAAIADGGNCAAPAPLVSHQNDGGSTCGGQIGINMGGVIFGHPSKVYAFTLNRSGPEGEVTPIIVAGTNIEAVVTSSCTAAPVALGANGMPVDFTGVPDGDYLLVVSTDPSINPTVPPTCGDFTVGAGILPVNLQEFSID